jgi:hypothetical protein
MSVPTIVSIRLREIGDRRFYHGQEIEPGLLEGELLDYWLDHKWCREAPERRSLYRLFASFSGCKEREALSQNELALFTIGG